MIPTRPLGATGLTVSALGLGTGQLGRDDLTDADAARLLDTALDVGVTLFDTARSYGRAEARLGAHLGARRRGVVLCTKGGYGIDGVPDWTGACITRGVDEALGRLRTDVIDVFFLHSCPLATLTDSDVIPALLRARDAGKIRVAGYSGENEPLMWAVRSGHFGAIECSVNLADQHSLRAIIPSTVERGVGVIAKRPLANAAWRFTERPIGDYAEVYWERLQAMRLDPAPLAWPELALRFSAFAPGVSAAVVGTASAAHFTHNAAAVAHGPLPAELDERVRAAWRAADRDWRGEI